MGWNRWYALRSYCRSALWIAPFLAFLTSPAAAAVIKAKGMEPAGR